MFFADLPEIHRRREVRGHSEIFDKNTRGTRPRYYLQNFHFQSGGWLTEESAERYDTQVEVLLNGTANAMRRQALPLLHELFAGRDQRQLRLLDIGCGTGRFLDFVKQAWPRLQIIGLDMSDAYVRHARRYLRRWSRTRFVVGKAEAIPFPDSSQDAVRPVTAVFRKTITNRTMQVIQRKISEHSLWRVASSMCEASWPSFLRLWFSQRHKPVRGATISVCRPKKFGSQRS